MVVHSATANSHQRTDSTQGLLSQSKPDFYGAQHDTPFQRCRQLSTTALSSKTSASSLATVPPSPSIDLPANRPRIVRISSSSSLHRQALETRATSAERLPLKRKRSSQNVRKLAAELGDSRADKEILELNTIVEERRTDHTRLQTPSPHHIAAIAPAMEVRARKETLNDIGSALARPFTARESSPHLANISESAEKLKRLSASRASPRVSRWLSGLLPTYHSQTPPPQLPPLPFYKCVVPPPPSSTRQRRASSQASMPGSSVASLDAPSLTAASSPTTTTITTKGHSRSLTAESRLTFRSPPSTIYGHEVLEDAVEHWPVVTSRSQVGLAI